MAKARVQKSDCDGYTSAALLLNYIYKILPSAIDNFSYSFHEGKKHGIDISAIPPSTTLVIAPDSSSNEFEIHQELKEKGIEVIVLDHHHSDEISKYACVVNNQLCDYPTKSLTGVGIVYKFCQYLDKIFETPNMVDEFIDIVSVGLVGDMADTREFETHYLISKGLSNIRNPFIKGMREKNEYSLGSVLSPIGVAFYIVPFINAITRVGTQKEKTLLFESMLDYKAFNLVPSTKRGCSGQTETILAQSIRTCVNVKNRQTRNQNAATDQIKQIIEGETLENKILAVRLPKADFDPGITGLIANQLMAEYQRPTLVLMAKEDEGKLVWSGSARGYNKSEKLNDFRKFCEDSGLVIYAQGHQNAFGFSILDENFDKFIEYSNAALADVEFSSYYKVDFIHHANTIKPQDIIQLGNLKSLWGQNMEEPLFALEHVQVTKDMVTLMSPNKNPTLKITLPNGICCIKFGSNEEEYKSLTDQELGAVTINLIGRPEVNRYYERVTPQIIIVDYEIIGKQQYYF